MGEIGFPRSEFLHDLRWWEVQSIIRGYRRRHALQYQIQRMQVWASMFCMGNPNKVKPDEIFPLYCDKFDDYQVPEVSQTEVDDMQGLINAENARLAALREAKK